MKTHLLRYPLVSCKKKVVLFAALTFFLCLSRTQAQTNTATGTVYGSNINGPAITSFNDGSADLAVQNPATTQITFDKEVDGFISISNNFSSFDLLATGGTLTGSETPTLHITGGTNLYITGGTFTGGSETVFSNDWNGAIGGLISGTATTVVSGTTFTGGTLTIMDSTTGGPPPIPGQTNSTTYQTPVAQGADGFYVENGYLLLTDASSMTGGDGQEADATRNDVFASGGNGLSLINSSAVISNGTYQGGNGGIAEVSASYSAYAQGGSGLYASNSTAVIYTGTFTGGAGGEVNGEVAAGGSGLVGLDGSSITNIGGSFTGSADIPAVQLYNSDLTSLGGLYTGGLLSSTTGSGTNTLSLLGGTFDSISFMNDSSNGVQFVTASNLVVSSGIYQDGGRIEINNIEDSGFMNLEVESGSMIFTEDLTLTGSLALNSADSKAVFFQGLEVANNATVDLGIGQIETAGAFNLMSGAALNLTIVTNLSGSITAGSADFSTNASLLVDASLAGFTSGLSTNTFLVTTGGVSGFNTNDVLTEVLVSNNTNVLGRTSFSGFLINANNLSALFSTATLSNYWNATGKLAVLANELEVLAPAEMNAAINSLGPDASKSAIEETYFTTPNTFQVAKQGLDAAVGLSLSRGAEFREQLLLPAGTKGPASAVNNDWRFWAKFYGQFYSRGQDGLNPEYDADIHGGVVGMDKSFGNLLVGISGGMGNYSITADSDADQGIDAYQGSLYATYGKGHAYIDAGLAYGMNQVQSQTAYPFILDGEFDAQLISGYLGGGWGFGVPTIGTLLTPVAAVRYTLYQQDPYTETSTTAVPRSFDEFDADSFSGSIGLNAASLNNISLSTFAFKLEGRAHWIREFNPQPGDLSYQLVGGNSSYLIAYPYLDEDTIQLGFGFIFFNNMKRSQKNVLLRLDFDELFGEDFNSHNLSAKVIYAF
ncbi:autotransporter domain-containing protein [Pontiellaceae bacterium B1224]|nr:autotransporter domain-containing protein [Pontiellaceae bacterium B1224]